ncbi:hypothetical protein NCIMB2158_90092 [Tenacibaculum maritimum]|uniref:hypothetical protein n=1 Tax=Tenacibaculum maritimum TaxID=107401 RepID=UPI0012E55FD0|nr:hypothetical protein [Tenacibaculum maritimum]CAA0257318.1 hypothetical protein NCIMB2158_90092 [Tenacibaculum maritimum]
MSKNSYDYLKDAFAAPLGDFIASIGEGVGEAQAALDKGSLSQTLEIYNEDPDNSEASLQLLREVGYQPTFYTIPKATAKAKIALSLSQQPNAVLNGSAVFKPKMYATPINATNSNRYNMNLNASAEIQFDIVPIPPSDSQLIRFLPNVILTNKKNAEGNLMPRRFKEIKLLLNEYNLRYAFSEEVKEEEVTEDTVFSTQIPAYFEGKKQILKVDDIIILGGVL